MREGGWGGVVYIIYGGEKAGREGGGGREPISNSLYWVSGITPPDTV